jgi:hypothetical protein
MTQLGVEFWFLELAWGKEGKKHEGQRSAPEATFEAVQSSLFFKVLSITKPHTLGYCVESQQLTYREVHTS